LSVLPHAQPGASRSAGMLPFGIAGVACIVAGGLVAAVTAPAATEHASWAAAYLVLVAGVAQVGLGVGQALLAPGSLSARLVAIEVAVWNLGNAAVLAGTLLGATPLVDAGGALLVAGLALLLRQARGSAAPHWPLLAFRLLVALLLVSIPIGLVLVRTRSG